MTVYDSIPVEGTATDTTRTADGPTRPVDCQCLDAGQGLPCWPCYRDGFNDPHPEAPKA